MISIVIGSWGSYNECNERALGSKWLKLADYECWEDILDELESEGFELDGIDEELFIQDIDGIDSYPEGFDEKSSIHDRLIDLLLKRYGERITERIAGLNAIEFFKNNI